MLGCSYGQGWLYGKPMKEDDAIAWLIQHRNATAATIEPLPRSA
ncbi:Diguanylate cyclase/phosphodiesterase (fragment) [Bradyrhizobium sp. STM 3809]